MPIKKDGTGKRWVEMELMVPGTPEQVWHAIATGPGYAAWFTRGEIEPRVGGTFLFDFGSGNVTKGQVTQWEPPHQFGYVEREWDAGAPPVATEITIASRSGNRCVIRMVHSLFTSSDQWDDQVEGFEAGWPCFFAVLRTYLAHFAGADAASFIATVTTPGTSLETWSRLGSALGLAGASTGERKTSSAGAEAWSGVVEHVYQDAKQRYLLVRLDGPSPGVGLVGTDERPGGTSVSVCRFFYGDDAGARAREIEPRWRDWLTRTFEAATSATPRT